MVLDAPKGTALQGDTLWVCDISVLRGFHRRTGAPLANVDLAPLGAVQLNDVDVGPDGMLRVTDTGIIMSRKGVVYSGPSRIFVRGPGGRIDTMPTSPPVSWPNGIRWDPTGKRWIVVSFDPFHGRIYAVPEAGGGTTPIRDGRGRLDGVVALPDGGIIFASWADSSIRLLAEGRERPLIRELPEAADIGLDTRRNRLAVPLSTLGRVQLWSLGTIGVRGAR